jgi:ubiquinone/menaquinone biosynthesis C-methylase UbiE
MKPTNDPQKDWFGDWANDYDHSLGKIKRHHKLLNLVVESSGVKDNDQVLDIGCGTGLLSLKFLKKAACQIHGVDCSPEMIEIFRRKLDQLVS